MTRTILLAAVLALGACNKSDDAKAKGEAFLDAYAEQLSKVATLVGKRNQPGAPADATRDAAMLVALARTLPTTPLPEAPATLTACRADAASTLDALRTALQPALDKANENPHVFRAIVLELAPKADAALRAIRTNIDSCKTQATNAGLATTRLDLLVTSWDLGV